MPNTNASFSPRMRSDELREQIRKLEQEGLIASSWGVSDNNRKARFYKLTRAGKKQIERDTRQWETMSAIMTRFLAANED